MDSRARCCGAAATEVVAVPLRRDFAYKVPAPFSRPPQPFIITILAGDKNMKINLNTVIKISLNFSDHENIFKIISKIVSQESSDMYPVPSAPSRAATMIVSVLAPESLSLFYLSRPHTAHPHPHPRHSPQISLFNTSSLIR